MALTERQTGMADLEKMQQHLWQMMRDEALAADQECKQPLLGARESGHVRMLGDVGTVALVAVVRYVETDFMQRGGPCQHLRGPRRVLEPAFPNLIDQQRGGIPDSLRLALIDLVASRHCTHGPLAGILVVMAPNEVVNRTLAQRLFWWPVLKPGEQQQALEENWLSPEAMAALSPRTAPSSDPQES